MKKILIILGLAVGLTGCMTSLQKADQFWTQKKFGEARTYYAKELAEQQQRAQLPVWNGKECRYRFNKDQAGRAIWGMAKTTRELDEREKALYYYFYFTQFCVRHGIKHEPWTEPWRDYLAEVPAPIPALATETNTALSGLSTNVSSP